MRFTIQRMILAIAVFAIALHVGLSYRRSGDYQRQAQFWTRATGAALTRAHNVESGLARLDGDSDEQKQTTAEQARRFAVYCSRLKSKYERAALFPWLHLEVDPPPP
jgi:hypothetical protein